MFKGYCYFIAACVSWASLWPPAQAATADERLDLAEKGLLGPQHTGIPVQGPRTTPEDGAPEKGDLQDEADALSRRMAEFCLSSPTNPTGQAAPWDDPAGAAAAGNGQHNVGAVGSSHQGPGDIYTPGQQLYGKMPFDLSDWTGPGHEGPAQGLQLFNLDDFTPDTDGTGGKGGITGVSRFMSEGIIKTPDAPHQNGTQRGAKAAAATNQQPHTRHDGAKEKGISLRPHYGTKGWRARRNATGSDDGLLTQPASLMASPVFGVGDDWRTPFRRTPSPSSDGNESDRESLEDEEEGWWQPYSDSELDPYSQPPTDDEGDY